MGPPDGRGRSSASRSSALARPGGPRLPRPAVDPVAVARGRRRSSASRRGSGARRSASATAGSRSRRTWPRRSRWSRLLVYLTVRAGYPARIGGRGASQRFTLLAAFTTAATFALLLFGSNVTATASALVFPDWPLMNGSLLPAVTDVTAAHVLHRWVAARGRGHRASRWRSSRGGPSATTRRSSGWPSVRRCCSRSRSSIGGAQVLTQLAEWTQTLHLALGAVIWAMLDRA